MSFKSSDFKKTTRKSDDGRVIYPHQIRDDRYTAAISYAITYYERMVGQRREQFEIDTLLEFFGEAKLARGFVACLSRTYTWRAQTIAEALGEKLAEQLQQRGISTPSQARAALYSFANREFGGLILPQERKQALSQLCRELFADLEECPLSAKQFERIISLDSEDQHLLIKQAAQPSADEIVALYNYHSLETAICHSDSLVLQIQGPVWNILRSIHNLTRRYTAQYHILQAPNTLFAEQLTVRLSSSRGRNLARILLRLLSAHPNSVLGGEANVSLRGQRLLLRLDQRALHVLGIGIQTAGEQSEAWESEHLERFQRTWSRAFIQGRTAGWRLRRDPEPLVASGAIVVPDFALIRGRERIMLCITTGLATTEALHRDLAKLGSKVQALAIVPSYAAERAKSCPVPLASYDQVPSEAINALVQVLDRRYPHHASAQQTPWQQLEHLVHEEGFVSEPAIAKILGCKTEEASQLVQRWGGPKFHVLPGIGVCNPANIHEIRELMSSAASLAHAA